MLHHLAPWGRRKAPALVGRCCRDMSGREKRDLEDSISKRLDRFVRGRAFGLIKGVLACGSSLNGVKKGLRGAFSS